MLTGTGDRPRPPPTGPRLPSPELAGQRRLGPRVLQRSAPRGAQLGAPRLPEARPRWPLSGGTHPAPAGHHFLQCCSSVRPAHSAQNCTRRRIFLHLSTRGTGREDPRGTSTKTRQGSREELLGGTLPLPRSQATLCTISPPALRLLAASPTWHKSPNCIYHFRLGANNVLPFSSGHFAAQETGKRLQAGSSLGHVRTSKVGCASAPL